MIVWINCLRAVKYTVYKLTLVNEFINMKLGERSGLIITELLFDRNKSLLMVLRLFIET